jgi:hypothetical protein
MNRTFRFLLLITTYCSAQNGTFPFRESFDDLSTLPAGWSTTTNKNPAGDFGITTSSSRSAPHALSSTDATRPQQLVFPIFDLSDRTADTLEFYERRSSTHHARVLVEAAIGSDTSFGIRISPDSLRLLTSSSYVRRVFALPETLSGKSAVRFRIRIIADASGTTGVYRVDDVRITIKKKVDPGLSSLIIFPAIPTEGMIAKLSILLKNHAAAGSFSGTIRLFDSLTLMREQPFQLSIGAGDSQMIILSSHSLNAGRHPFTVTLLCTEDEDTSNNTVSALVIVGHRTRSLLINECMYLPAPGMPEWIELVNPTDDTVTLAGWRISDGGTTKAMITSSSLLMPPREYGVITTDTSAFNEYFPSANYLFQASFSSLNNSGDAIVLFDQTLSVIDSLSYLPLWGGAPGRSLERIDTAIGSTVSANWKTTIHPDGGTPGMINSVTPKQFDAAVVRITVQPIRPRSGSDFSATITVRNAGREKITHTLLQVLLDRDLDSMFTENEILISTNLPPIERNDSAQVTIIIPGQRQGFCRIGAEAIYDDDREPANDLRSLTIMVGPRPNCIVINEIMAAPAGDIPEWIEGYNRSPDSVRIIGWRMSDNGTTKAQITGGTTVIPPRGFFIVTTDTTQFLNAYPAPDFIFQSAFSGLNNTTGDAVVMIDEMNEMMDSIHYRPEWGVNGNVSLQRFDSEHFGSDSSNWRSAPPTPGTENKIARKRIDAELYRATGVRTSDGFALHASVRNIGREPLMGASLRMDLASSSGEHIFSIPLPLLAPYDTASATFEWKSERHGTSHISIRCVADDDERMENNTAEIPAAFPFPHRSMVINEIMYEPLSGEAEFVELQNRGPDTLDVKGWSLLDQPGSSGSRSVMYLSDSVLLLPPNGFLVIASDSVFFSRYPEAEKERTVIHPALSLSNSGEDLVLRDLTGAEIDSMRYSPQWHLRNIPTAGRSLERINSALSSTEGKNWSTSASRNGATPLTINSIHTAVVSAGMSIRLSPNPFSPDHDGHEDFLSVNYTLPSASSMIRVRIYDVTGRLVRRLEQNGPSSSTGSVLWNGMDDEGRKVRIGMYIVLLEALDNFGGMIRTMKDVAVVARRL